MNTLVSICIPTYQRPDMLKEAVESCLAQTYADLEIIISDDSKDDSSEKLARTFTTKIPVRYYRNSPSLGQAENVNHLFDLAQGDRLVLLHDDDLLMPDAVEKLARCWDLEPDIAACYGKQHFIDAQGNLLPDKTDEANKEYFRDTAHAGLQASSLQAGLVGQFPNDGYMILTKAAQAVRYKNSPDVGDACDYDFGIRLASAYERFYFLNDFTAKYRISTLSVSTNNNISHLLFGLAESVAVPPDVEEARTLKLRHYAVPAVTKWLRLGQKKKAFHIYSSSYYPVSQKIRPKGIVHLLLFLFPRAVIQSLLRFR